MIIASLQIINCVRTHHFTRMLRLSGERAWESLHTSARWYTDVMLVQCWPIVCELAQLWASIGSVYWVYLIIAYMTWTAGSLSRRLCPSKSKSINVCTCDPDWKRFQIIALTSHFGFHDLVTLKLGQGHWMSNLTFRLVSCTWGNKNEGPKARRYEVIALTSIWTARQTACLPDCPSAFGDR